MSKVNNDQSKNKIVILGQQMARAIKAEERWAKKKRFKTESPLPKETYSDFEAGYGIIDPKQVVLDFQISTICQKFTNSNEKERNEIRDAISMDEFYRLITFSQRASVFAIREKNVEWITNGLISCTMIDIERIDFRDIYVGLSLLYHAAQKIEEDADQLFLKAAKISNKKVSERILSYVKSPSTNIKSMGFDEIVTPNGIGFINWNLEKYNPSYDLKKIALEISAFIEEDKYNAGNITAGSGFPKFWLETENNKETLEKIIPLMKGCVMVRGNLRSEEHPNNNQQLFIIFVVEMEDDRIAETLQKLAVEKRPSSYCMLGLAETSLFCLVVARSIVQGVVSFETEESIRRFGEGLSNIIKKNSI